MFQNAKSTHENTCSLNFFCIIKIKFISNLSICNTSEPIAQNALLVNFGYVYYQ